jgi:hypothetical membrane protein
MSNVAAVARGRDAPASSQADGTRGWALVSATVAPIALVGGWTTAAHLQPAGYSAIHHTISALAAHGAHDRSVMTIGLLLLGLCHLVTAAGLRPAHGRGRLTLAVGGAATVAVAAFPQPHTGSSLAHTASASIAFIALATWPALAARRGNHSLLARSASGAASVALVGLLVWFAIALNGSDAGLAERILAAAQAGWPLAVVINTLAPA